MYTNGTSRYKFRETKKICEKKHKSRLCINSDAFILENKSIHHSINAIIFRKIPLFIYNEIKSYSLKLFHVAVVTE